MYPSLYMFTITSIYVFALMHNDVAARIERAVEVSPKHRVTYTYMCVYIYIYIYNVYIYTCRHIFIYTYICIHIHVYIHTPRSLECDDAGIAQG